jgi:hypothetical protein
MERTKGDASEVSLMVVTTGQAFASAPLVDSIVGGDIPEKAVQQEGSALLGADVGSSQALVHAGGDPHAWEGPTLRWADRRNLEATGRESTRGSTLRSVL